MSWRRIDIDQYDEDAYTEDEILADFDTGLSPEQIESNAQVRSSDVRNLMTKGDLNSALIRSLEDPPYGRNVDNAKFSSTQTVVDLLNGFRATDIPDTIKNLSSDQRDVLMKYLYAGMAKPEVFNSSVLLTWHEKLTEVAGTGSIVRVMTDKRTLV
ncbi:actin-related protein 2/3 complex subunit 5 [Halteromyces radiatus]|uniref:actin-related protein 2/3 complex subunit 5 n=1 Tax=Halteromyces radiatus TaxID=101107 RepID=UPI00221EE142|nr:actin-related protein 2/3 complex subunit 5 [Halteromyces radiatus]KAI8093272.1 actin-related protein 2/3 complex subunit 5 [Halteromyces radiatus]